MTNRLALKIDIDTEIGTRIGTPKLLDLLQELKIPATFYLSLGPDHTGRALKRLFRKDSYKNFFKKCARTNVVSTYGIRTLLNGVLLPGPHIGRKNKELLRTIKARGFNVGIHAYDHQKWQNDVMQMSQEEVAAEWQKASDEFWRIFNEAPITAAAPGWQANAKTLAVYDEANLKYASDCRGTSPFYPRIDGKVYKTLQIPTTLPTLDELLGRPEFPQENLINHYLTLIKKAKLNVLNIHPELEGMQHFEWFRELLIACQKAQINFITLGDIATADNFPVCDFTQQEIDGRAGKVAVARHSRESENPLAVARHSRKSGNCKSKTCYKIIHE